MKECIDITQDINNIYNIIKLNPTASYTELLKEVKPYIDKNVKEHEMAEYVFLLIVLGQMFENNMKEW